MKRVFSIMVVLGLWVTAAFGQNGYVGIYADSTATTFCTSVPQGTGKTLYVIARLQGGSANGITGAELRIEVSNPAGWFLSYTPPTSSYIIGSSIFDLEPTNPDDGSGMNISFQDCRTAANGRVALGSIDVFNLSGNPTTLTVKRRSHPTNPNYPCPLFVLCDSPLYSKLCMTAGADSSCTLQKPTTAAAPDQPVFVAGLNIGTGAPPPLLTGSELVEQLRVDNHAPINFILNAAEERVPVSVQGNPGTVTDILDQLVANDSHYRYRTIQGRIVVYPASPIYEQELVLPAGQFEDRGRFETATAYTRWLKEHVPGFEDLVPPPFFGDPRALATDEHITLSERATVLEHFVQLLGSKPSRVFTVAPAPSGLPMLAFRIIEPFDQGSAAPSKPWMNKAGTVFPTPLVDPPCACAVSDITYTYLNDWLLSIFCETGGLSGKKA